MDDAAGVAASSVRGASLPMLTQQPPPARKEWRVVSEHPARSVGNDVVEFDRSRLGQSDERTIYEVQQGRESCDEVNFCSIQMDGLVTLDEFEHKLQDLAKRREDLQQMEIGLRADMIARSGIMEMQNNFDAQIKEQANITAKLQEKLEDRERRIMELERKMEDSERELHAIRLDKEAAWATEDLLREQNKELESYRRNHDNVEAERAHNMKQVHDLQEHIQDKERQVMDLQEQHRIAQETILYKDEQLREAQAWITRAQEMDVLHSSTNHSLQAELRERTEQYNQLWLGCQRQFVEMERLHAQNIQQLQLELAGAREKSGAQTHIDESHVSRAISTGVLHFGQDNGSHHNADGAGSSSGDSVGASNGNAESFKSFTTSEIASPQAAHIPGVPINPSILGASSYLPPEQVAVHPYVMHQQGANHSLPASVPQSLVGHFPFMPAMSSYQHWQSQQGVSDVLQQGSSSASEAENNLNGSDSNGRYKTSANGEHLQSDYFRANLSEGMDDANPVIISTGGFEAFASVDNGYATLQEISSQFRDALKLDPLGQTDEIKDNTAVHLGNESSESLAATTESSGSGESPPSERLTDPVASTETIIVSASNGVTREVYTSVEQTNSVPTVLSGPSLLDERSLLACIVRTIPAGGRISISSTLPNRLGKMLAPLHWHDYRKKCGKLDEFVASHPELFLIEGDYIQLREGAQGIIAASAAVEKVAAAAAANGPYPSLFPSVAVTPMAQANRSKKIPSAEGVLGKHGSGSEANGTVHGKGHLNARSGANYIGKQRGRVKQPQLVPRR